MIGSDPRFARLADDSSRMYDLFAKDPEHAKLTHEERTVAYRYFMFGFDSGAHCVQKIIMEVDDG